MHRGSGWEQAHWSDECVENKEQNLWDGRITDESTDQRIGGSGGELRVVPTAASRSRRISSGQKGEPGEVRP